MLSYQAPKPYHTITPYFTVKSVDDTIDFLKNAFNAQVKQLMKDSTGRSRHAEVLIGDSYIMMGQSRDENDTASAMLYIYTNDCDSLYQQALQAGATSILEPADQFYGDRSSGVLDPFGNKWWIAQRKEDLSREQVQKRMNAMGQG